LENPACLVRISVMGPQGFLIGSTDREQTGSFQQKEAVMKKGFMTGMISLFLFVVLVNFAHSIDLYDSSDWKCSNGILNIGDSKYDVINKCGEPTSREEFGEPTVQKEFGEPIFREDHGTVWVYDFGSTKFIYYITFDGDRVERIQYGEYGHDKAE
jgi:hypothetical protein